MFEIVKIYKESLPDLKFIGKKYTNEDRINGGFGAKWGEFWKNDWFDLLESTIKVIKSGDLDAYCGFMRIIGGKFEYWIGMFGEKESIIPEGFAGFDLSAREIANCWIYGREDNGEIYGAEVHNSCVDKIKAQEWQLSGETWEDGGFSFERYQCPRYTSNDGNGKVILDYCISLK